MSRLPRMNAWTRTLWTRTDAEPTRLASTLVADLELSEGSAAPLLPEELLNELATDPRCSHWYAGEEHLGFGLLRPDGVFRAVLQPDQREMSLFLPMLAWAESVRRAQFPDATLQVIAQDDDVCLPFLLLRLDFVAEDEGWTRSDDPRASTFRIYSGGRIDTEDDGTDG
ncbi:MAG: hypothetical protein R3E97_18935 [Candidatus Eisenbacteria bacterium]